MATNFKGVGNSIQLIAPSGGVTGGNVYKQGKFIGVVEASAAEGEAFTLNLTNVYEVPKEAPLAITAGDELYWVAANSNFNKTASGNTYGGKAFADAASADTTVLIRLDN